MIKKTFNLYVMAWAYYIEWIWAGKRLCYAEYRVRNDYQSDVKFMKNAKAAKLRHIRSGRFREFRKMMAKRKVDQREIMDRLLYG